jgi:hypothetical protein
MNKPNWFQRVRFNVALFVYKVTAISLFFITVIVAMFDVIHQAYAVEWRIYWDTQRQYITAARNQYFNGE